MQRERVQAQPKPYPYEKAHKNNRRTHAARIKHGKLTESVIISKVSTASGIAKDDVELIYRLIFKVMKDGFNNGKMITVSEFGSFMIRKLEERIYRTGHKYDTTKGHSEIFKKGTEIIVPCRPKLRFMECGALRRSIWNGAIKRHDVPPAIRVLASDKSIQVPNDVAVFV